MKKVKSLFMKALCITPILSVLCGMIIAHAEEMTTLSVYPLWYAEPEVPEVLLNKIN